MSQPLISTIVCVRDGEKYLGEALDSIAAQDRRDLEVIVIDDGSKDASAEIAGRHPVAPRVASQEPLNVNAALNHGIRLARGRYLTFLDSDDVWPDGRLRPLLEAVERDPALDCVFGKVVNTDASLSPLNVPHPARLLGSLLIKRESALKVGAFRTDIHHAAMIDWTSRGIAAGLRFLAVDEIVLLRRIHGANLGMRDRPGARIDLLRVIRDHHKRMS
jgi:glycosyltransferase involved in cell wall biosynthesis